MRTPDTRRPLGMARNVQAMLICVSDAAAGRRELAAAPLFGDSLFAGQLAPGEQTGAKPPGFSGLRAKESLGLYALRVGVVAERVCAGWREKTIINPAGHVASDPGGVADPITCFATTVAAAGFSLQLVEPPHDCARRVRRRLSGR